MSITHCHKQAREGVMDLPYIERRLDEIDARIDDLCGLLGSVLEALGVDSVETPPPPPVVLTLFEHRTTAEHDCILMDCSGFKDRYGH